MKPHTSEYPKLFNLDILKLAQLFASTGLTLAPNSTCNFIRCRYIFLVCPFSVSHCLAQVFSSTVYSVLMCSLGQVIPKAAAHVTVDLQCYYFKVVIEQNSIEYIYAHALIHTLSTPRQQKANVQSCSASIVTRLSYTLLLGNSSFNSTGNGP